MKTKLLLLLLCTWAGYPQELYLEPFATGFTNLTEITHAGDSRLFVAEQGGLIKIAEANGTVVTEPFLNISALISSGNERGLLGLAFHPEYETNGYFYVNYTNTVGNTVVARYTRSTANPNAADAGSASIILTVNQPQANHNGGCLRFGPDGYLYIAMGDGGGSGDPDGNAQNKNSLLGKMLRIDVDGAAPYGIPEDNPFVGIEGADEIWAYGLRNPWKFSFNRLNGDIWIADVGQEEIEEINKVASNGAGLNYGWRCFEGTEVYNSNGCSLVEMYIQPFAEYTHTESDGCSITGGYVYTGSVYPGLQNKYIFADFCTNKLGWADDEGTITFTPNTFSGNNFTAFGEGMDGELYVGGKASGTVYSIMDTDLSTTNPITTTFSLYPNPAKNKVHVSNVNNGGNTTVKVFDLGGKLLIQQPLAADNSIDTSALRAGLYMLQLDSSNGTAVQKLVIN